MKKNSWFFKKTLLNSLFKILNLNRKKQCKRASVFRGQMGLDNPAANERKMGVYQAGQLDAKSEQGVDVPPASSEYSGKLVKRWHLVLAHVPILSYKTNPGTQHISCHLPFFFQRKSDKILHFGETSAFKATIAGNVDDCALQKMNPRACFVPCPR